MGRSLPPLRIQFLLSSTTRNVFRHAFPVALSIGFVLGSMSCGKTAGEPPTTGSSVANNPTSLPAGIGVLQMVSVGTDGSPGNGDTFTTPSISADGRYVAFQSTSTNLVPGAASGFADIFL